MTGTARPQVLSVNVGAPVQQRVPRAMATGIAKEPVPVITVSDPGPRRIEHGAAVSGVAGDFIGNGRHHGGSEQAVYAVAREELDHWARELGRELAPGAFGENLTTVGLDVDAAEVGDIWRVGTAVLRVQSPRVPCSTFAARMEVRGWVRRFAERGRAGAYLSVLEPGQVRPDDDIALEPGGSGIDLPLVLRALMGDPPSARTVLAADLYRGRQQATLTKVAARA